MANVKNNSATQHTRRCLLQAAGEIFAEHGYHAATIKEITDRAGASLASVNYHFKDKSELYAAVLRDIGEQIVQKIPPDNQLMGSSKTRFRQFIQWYCLKACDISKNPWQQILMAREVAQPTIAFDWLLKEYIRPLFDKLAGLVAELLELEVQDELVGFVTASVFGQCSYFLRHQRLLSRLHPQLGEHADMQHLAAHVADFSLAGIGAFRGRDGAKASVESVDA
jgi:AcrR family transcriptional regulator